MDRTFESLTAVEDQWLLEQLDRAREFAHKFASGVSDDEVSLESLDQAFANYLAADGQASDANAVVMAVGIAFGRRLADDLGFRWVIATDDYGSDIAVLARSGRGDVAIFPTEFVAKRYERREAPFLIAALAEIRDSLREIAIEWGDAF